MGFPESAMIAEQQGWGNQGRQTLADAYHILKREWDGGNHEREVGLHLLFLSFYGLVEPQKFTGFREDEATYRALRTTFEQVHASFERPYANDAEFLYVVGLIANMFAEWLGDAARWRQIAVDYRPRYRALAPAGLNPAVFTDRGAYGDYFRGHVQVADGY